MHGLRQIVQMNKEQQEFIDHVLAQPTPEVNLLRVWQDWKEEQNQKQGEYINEPVSLPVN